MKGLFATFCLVIFSTAFGNDVIYLGLADSVTVSLKDKCPSAPSTPGGRCIELNAQPGSTTFDEADVASINLPPDATDSLICFSFAPVANRTFRNTTAATNLAELRVSLSVKIESAVLLDPSLVDPYSGLPLNGSLPHGMLVGHEMRHLAAGAMDYDAPSHSRNCAYGFVRRSQLIDYYGLTPTQADDFFDGPITITFGLRGSASLIESMDYRFVIRLYGDRK